MYLNSTVSEEVEIAQESPAIKAWDTQKLKKREKQEMKMGGFGKLPIKEGLEYVEKPKKSKMTRTRIQNLKYHPGNIPKIIVIIKYTYIYIKNSNVSKL